MLFSDKVQNGLKQALASLYIKLVHIIKATIHNSLYCTEIRFPCSETELSKKLGELGVNTEHLVPIGMIIDIEPAELSMLDDCEVCLDALNFLGICMDGMCNSQLSIIIRYYDHLYIYNIVYKFISTTTAV